MKNIIHKIKCLIKQVNGLIAFRPLLVFDPITRILTSTYINGQTAETVIPCCEEEILSLDTTIDFTEGLTTIFYVDYDNVAITSIVNVFQVPITTILIGGITPYVFGDLLPLGTDLHISVNIPSVIQLKMVQ